MEWTGTGMTHHDDGPDRLGRADLHIHTLASDGVAGIDEILDHVEQHTDLDVIGIADHERVDAALAARALARARNSRVEVIVGEEVTTRGGHLLALFLQERVRPLQSFRATIAAVHEQGGLAIAAHPLAPYPICASGRSIRRLQADPDPRFHLDALEAFNPTSARQGRRAGRRTGDGRRRRERRAPAGGDRHGIHHLPGAHGRGPAARDPGAPDGLARRVLDVRVPGGHVRAAAAQVHPRHP
jgi:predicted metal-dependent phosphoesterase TrpH